MHFSINSPIKSEISMIVTVNNHQVYQDNIIASTSLYKDKIELITLYNNYSASTSLNTGLELATKNIIICCHKDIFFSFNWYDNLMNHINTLNTNNQKWGVLGFAGADFKGNLVGTHSGLSMNNKDIIQVQTLDGSILILNKENNLKFDENLRYFHMYDIDICLQAIEKQLPVYCLNIPIKHKSYRTTGNHFQESLEYIQEKWKHKVGIINTTVGRYTTNY